jgi:uncharacterized protein (DUF58 family)
MIKITRAGKIFVFILLVVGVIAVIYQKDTLYMILSIFFAFFILSGNMARKNIENAQIDVKFGDEVYAKKETKLEVIVTNKRKYLPLYLIQIKIMGKDLLFLNIAKNAKASQEVNVVFDKRGTQSITDIQACSIFPFNFVLRCQKSITINKEITVFPELRPCKSLVNSTIQSMTAGYYNSGDKSGNEDEVYTIRDYIVGDSLKLISWKATAKTDRLKSKELSVVNSPSAVIDFDAIDIKDLEMKLSCITTLVNKLIASKSEVGFRCKKFFVPASLKQSVKLRIFRYLANYGLSTQY